LAEAFAKGAAAHHHVEIVSVRDYKVNPCLGCNKDGIVKIEIERPRCRAFSCLQNRSNSLAVSKKVVLLLRKTECSIVLREKTAKNR
jgi:hypothetical protein